jgi:CDP-diacylglycerol---glycerol-3-phosphate 3-phosphatidyltransferase
VTDGAATVTPNGPSGGEDDGCPTERAVGISPHRSTFGPSALLTPANGITAARLAASPVLVAIILLWGASWAAFSLGGVIALSDGFDGWIARKQGATRSGAFLDPLADKVAVLGALVALVIKGVLWWAPVAVIAVREIAMSVYRSVVGRHGVSVPARSSAKLKTLAQDIAVGLCLAPPLVTYASVHSAGIWVAAALTVFTGGQYYLDGRRLAASRGSALSSEGTAAGPRTGSRGGTGDHRSGPGTSVA